MSIQPETPWLGCGRLFAQETGEREDGKTGIFCYNNLITKLFMAKYSVSVEFKGEKIQLNRESAKKFFGEEAFKNLTNNEDIDAKIKDLFHDKINESREENTNLEQRISDKSIDIKLDDTRDEKAPLNWKEFLSEITSNYSFNGDTEYTKWPFLMDSIRNFNLEDLQKQDEKGKTFLHAIYEAGYETWVIRLLRDHSISKEELLSLFFIEDCDGKKPIDLYSEETIKKFILSDKNIPSESHTSICKIPVYKNMSLLQYFETNSTKFSSLISWIREKREEEITSFLTGSYNKPGRLDQFETLAITADEINSARQKVTGSAREDNMNIAIFSMLGDITINPGFIDKYPSVFAAFVELVQWKDFLEHPNFKSDETIITSLQSIITHANDQTLKRQDDEGNTLFHMLHNIGSGHLLPHCFNNKFPLSLLFTEDKDKRKLIDVYPVDTIQKAISELSVEQLNTSAEPGKTLLEHIEKEPKKFSTLITWLKTRQK